MSTFLPSNRTRVQSVLRDKPCVYLLVEVKKTFWTVDIMERGKASDSAINVHRMSSQRTSTSNKQPVGVGTTQKHLKTQHTSMIIKWRFLTHWMSLI